MINEKILEKLTPITPEESVALKGENSVNWKLYNEKSEYIVNAKKLLDKGKLITFRPHTRFIHFPPHTHDYIEMIYMCRGTTKHIINGNELTLNSGELLFLGQNTKQEILPANENDIAVNFIILPQFFENIISMLGEEDTPLRRFIISCLCSGEESGKYLYFKVSDILPIQNLIENLLWNLIFGSPSKRQISKTTMGLLFLQLLNYTDRLTLDNTSEEETVKLFKYIEENYKNGSLTEIAHILNYDIYHLSREINRKFGKNFTELMQDKRLSQAAFLLKTTSLKVSEIANSVGYENISYFHRIFNKKFSVSPREFRLANKDTFSTK